MFDPLGFRHRCPQSDGDIVGEMVPPQGENGSMFNRTVHVNSNICGPTPDIDEGHAEFFFVRS